MILDGHTHVFPEEVCRYREDYFNDEPAFRMLYESPKSKLVTPPEMVGAMEEAGVTAAVVMGFPWRREALWRRQHEVILEAMRRFPRTLIGFCAVHILEPGAAREVERCLAAGFRGVGELAEDGLAANNDDVALVGNGRGGAKDVLKRGAIHSGAEWLGARRGVAGRRRGWTGAAVPIPHLEHAGAGATGFGNGAGFETKLGSRPNKFLGAAP